MNKIFPILICLGSSLSCFCQAEVSNKTIEVSKDFVVDAMSINTDNPNKQVAITLNATYSTKRNNIVLRFDNVLADTIPLNYPLNFYFFRNNFDTLFLKKHPEYVGTYKSHLEIFYWLTTVSEGLSEKPLAGKLIFNNYTLISTEDKNKRQKLVNQEDRTKKINIHMDNVRLQEAKLNSILSNKIVADYYFKKDSVISDSPLTFRQISTMSIVILKDTAERNYDFNNVSNFLDPDSDSFLVKTESSEQLPFPIVSVDLEDLKLIEIKRKSITELNKNLDTLNKKLVKIGIHKIEEVKLHFERGFLERVQVYLKMENGNLEIFENAYPIGFTSIPNYEDFSNIKLTPRNNRNKSWGESCFIYLSDVIQNYDNELDLATKDYSPADTVLSVFPNQTPTVKLHKQKSMYIIDGKTFTDLNGFSETSPNGLVQVELNRRFNLNTKRFQIHKQINFGYFTYINAQVNFSKIENKLKGLPLRNEMIVENQAVVSPSYATNLDFLRYENLSLRTEINTIIYDVPHYKLTYYLDFGLKYGHTPVLDSTYTVSDQGDVTGEAIDLDAHSFTMYPKLWIELFAERRYGIKVAYQANYTRIFTNNNFKQVLSYSDKGLDLTSLTINPAARWSHSVEAFVYFDANPKSQTGKIFALARFHFQNKDINTFYPQILLGYAFNIFR